MNQKFLKNVQPYTEMVYFTQIIDNKYYPKQKCRWAFLLQKPSSKSKITKKIFVYTHDEVTVQASDDTYENLATTMVFLLIIRT